MSLNRKTLQIYYEQLRADKRVFVLLWLLLPLPVIVQGVVNPLLYAEIVDKLSQFAGGDAIDRTGVMVLFWWLVAGNIFEFGVWRYIDFRMIRFQTKILRNLDRKVFDWYMQLSYSFHIRSFGGSLVARGRRFVNEFERLYDTIYFEVSPLIIRFTFFMLVLGWRAPLIAVVLFVWSVLYVAAQFWIIRRKMPITRAAAEADSKVTGNLADSITNIASVKSFGRTEYESTEFKKTTRELFHKRLRSWTWDFYIRTWQAVLMIFASLAVLYLSIDLLFAGTITIGTVVLISLYVRRLFDDLWSFGRTMMRLERSLSDAAEMTKTFMEPLSVADPIKPLKPKITKGAIRFNNVTFEYEDAEGNAVFSKLSLSIEPGSRVGLVGASGGGKTTLTKLLLRLYDTSKGSITIDGQNIAKLTQADLRDAIAYVPQEPVLFHRSLADNIRYGQLSASDDDIRAAAKLARADLFIDKLPKGYETLVGERGTKLSGGEKQRVAIARAALKNAPILVLDEATSALDSESEKLIQAAFDDLMKNRTTIVIAHRLSTIQKMDRIIVLDGGAVVEDGTHKQLLDKGGVYAKLWSHQSGGFLED